MTPLGRKRQRKRRGHGIQRDLAPFDVSTGANVVAQRELKRGLAGRSSICLGRIRRGFDYPIPDHFQCVAQLEERLFREQEAARAGLATLTIFVGSITDLDIVSPGRSLALPLQR